MAMGQEVAPAHVCTLGDRGQSHWGARTLMEVGNLTAQGVFNRRQPSPEEPGWPNGGSRPDRGPRAPRVSASHEGQGVNSSGSPHCP